VSARRATARLLPLAALLLAGVARAQAPAGGDIDDPKLARRLKTRVTLPAAADAAAPLPEPGVAAAVALSPPAPAAVPADPDAATTVARRAPPPAPQDEGRTPFLGVAYRHFSFVQLGATEPGSMIGKAASEPFSSLSLDFYPISHVVRFGTSTQYGWQSANAAPGGGDYFVAQSFTLGLQLPSQYVTPYFEGLAGAGYMRRFQFDRTIPTAYWQFGLDVGAQAFVSRHGYVSLAVGYLRAVNGFLQEQSFTSVYLDTWSFKIGVGI
jgi:hypothetical protein